MKRDRVKGHEHLSLEEFFNNLLQLENGPSEGRGAIYARDGHRVISSYVGAKLKYRRQEAKRNIDELARLGYVKKLYSDRNCIGIEFLLKSWNQGRNSALKAVPLPNMTPRLVDTKQQPRTFALFMDYRNLELGLPDSVRRFRDFSWLLNPILAQGKIVFAFVFIPDNYGARLPIHQLSNKHSFIPVLCTRKTADPAAKDRDGVDAKMDSLARSLIEHTDITDIVIVSGDADFQDLANFARYHQKGVTVVSAAQAISGRFLNMAEAGAIRLALH